MPDFQTLDLHGLAHEDGEFLIEKFITDHLDLLPVKVITGHSVAFIGQTHEIAAKYGLYCRPERGYNKGCWLVFEDAHRTPPKLGR